MKSLRQKGFILADFLVSAGLLGLIITLLAVALGGFSKFNQCQWARQRCLAAAMAQLDSITATGSPVGAQELERLWPQVTLSVDRSPASGPWAGLELIQVTASAGQAKVRLVRYLRPQPAVAKGGQS
jgi:type II secretory pathway pseudopilin PulG